MKRKTVHNSGLAKGGVSCFVETFVQGSTFVLRMNFSAKYPALRQAAKPLAVIFHDTQMKLKAFIFQLTFPLACFSQDTIRISKIDTLLPFFGKLPIRLNGYENRTVPFESKNPFYVLITYKDGKNKKILSSQRLYSWP